ncbi:MAG: 30S ribosome-binding factor RbfA [Clostridiales bacterium]|nr:30S ribosome-binding factor RbfA [Clostridiales bacterium]
MAYPRTNRINEEVKKVISSTIRTDLKDPRIASMTSIVDVDVTRDLSYVTVYISVLGSDKEKRETLEGLKKASGYLRKEIGKKVKLRIVPEVIFKMDTSIEKSFEIFETLSKYRAQNESKDTDNE